MCAICGVIYTDRNHPVDERQLRRMRDVMEHRGPDDAGLYVDAGAALGSRRLAIMDLSPRGHMPMQTPDGRYTIVYNGEVYNFREMRPALAARGYQFVSDCDTEVLLALYAEHGPAMLDRLNGMFSFAVWDSLERTLFLARDHVGIKPLYYAWHNQAFYFASEEKALFAAGVPASFDTATWEELLCFRFVAGERTPFTGVRRLLPGHSLIVRDGEARGQRWWNLAERARDMADSLPGQPDAWLRETFDDSVRMRRISDVPIGVLLSGGLDSSSVAASLASQEAGQVSTFTVRFDEAQFDEGDLAHQVMRRWNLKGHEITVEPDTLVEQLAPASWLNDEPLAHGSDMHLLAIAQHAKPKVTVLLSGEGADELLGGYVRYKPLCHPALLSIGRQLLPAFASQLPIGGRLRKLAGQLAIGSLRDLMLFNSSEIVPDDLHALGMQPNRSHPAREAILDEAAVLYPGELARQAMYLDQHTFLCSLLDRNDRMTMGASIECRVPFLDPRLVIGLAAMPSSMLQPGRRKRLLRQAVGDRLPPAVLHQPKWGFGVPWNTYLSTVPAFRELVRTLPDAEPIVSGPFSRPHVKAVMTSFLNGDTRQALLVRQLLAVSTWYGAALPGVSRLDAGAHNHQESDAAAQRDTRPLRLRYRTAAI
jgi:asparagine synthase (glutamine-hydrolysing)